jgi:hypothetical protein
MKPFLQLNLHSDSEKTEAANLPIPENQEPESEETRKRLNQIANRAAHKAAAEYGRYASRVFSK